MTKMLPIIAPLNRWRAKRKKKKKKRKKQLKKISVFI